MSTSVLYMQCMCILKHFWIVHIWCYQTCIFYSCALKNKLITSICIKNTKKMNDLIYDLSSNAYSTERLNNVFSSELDIRPVVVNLGCTNHQESFYFV